MTASRNTLYEGPRIAPPADHAPLPTLYWNERVSGWWPGIPTRCTRSCGGVLEAIPPGATATRGPGVVVCATCSREVAWIETTRIIREALTAEDFAPRRGRPPKQQRWPATACACETCGACRMRRWRNGTSVRRRNPVGPLTCEHCRRAFTSDHRDQRFCGRACMGAAKRERALIACGQCGVSFSRRDDRQRYCSVPCVSVARWGERSRYAKEVLA
jgi:hypothetical protein